MNWWFRFLMTYLTKRYVLPMYCNINQIQKWTNRIEIQMVSNKPIWAFWIFSCPYLHFSSTFKLQTSFQFTAKGHLNSEWIYESSFLPKYEPIMIRISALSVLCYTTIFGSYFGRNDEFINSFWNLLTFIFPCFPKKLTNMYQLSCL